MRRVGFRRQVLIWMLFVALIPGGVIAVVDYVGARDALLEAAQTRALCIVGARRDQIHHWLAERDKDLRVLGASRECSDHVAHQAAGERHHEVCDYLDTFQSRSLSYHRISLYDCAWKWIIGTPGDGPGGVLGVHPDLAERAKAGAEDGRLGLATRRLDGGGVGLALARDLRTPRAKARAGHVVTLLDLSRTLWPLLAQRTGLGRSGAVYLIGGGRYLSPPRVGDEARVLMPDDGTASGQDDLAARFYSDYRGVPVIGAHARLPGRDWVVVSEIEMTEALAGLTVVRRRAVAISVLSLVAVLLLSLVLSHQLTRPLHALARVARRVSAGGRDARAAVEGGAETREVGQAFNQMLDDLAVARDRIAHTAALAAIGELSASVVHQMRNPMSSVKLNLQALTETAAGKDRELGGIALDQVARLERMLDELLRFGKPIEPVIGEVGVAELLADATQLVEPSRLARRAIFEVDDRCPEARVRVDRDLIAQAVANLLTNALQAGPEGATVGIVAERRDDGGLRVDVVDRGEGIPPGAQDKLFRPFFTTRREGTGLGLAFVNKVAELHQGSVYYVAMSEGGSRFRITLPSAR